MGDRLLLRLQVIGRPKPQGSLRTLVPKGGGKPRTMHDDKIEDYRSLLASEIARRWTVDGSHLRPPFTGAVRAILTCGYARPQSHYWPTNRNHDGELRHDAPEWPTANGFGDVDKLQRMVGDALQLAGVLTDDRLIVDWSARKVWADDPTTSGFTSLALYRA